MIEYVKGSLEQVTPTTAVIEAAGLGYLLNISLNTFSAIEHLKEAKLLTHEVIREDTHELFGFYTELERTLFRLLIGVSGVGPNTARMILSSLTPAELQHAISADDHSRLKAVKGIGLKTAQRIIVDLKDKIITAGLLVDDAEAPYTATAPAADSQAFDEALAALVMLGFARPASQKVLRKLFDADPSLTVEAAIKRSLTML